MSSYSGNQNHVVEIIYIQLLKLRVPHTVGRHKLGHKHHISGDFAAHNLATFHDYGNISVGYEHIAEFGGCGVWNHYAVGIEIKLLALVVLDEQDGCAFFNFEF